MEWASAGTWQWQFSLKLISIYAMMTYCRKISFPPPKTHTHFLPPKIPSGFHLYKINYNVLLTRRVRNWVLLVGQIPGLTHLHGPLLRGSQYGALHMLLHCNSHQSLSACPIVRGNESCSPTTDEAKMYVGFISWFYDVSITNLAWFSFLIYAAYSYIPLANWLGPPKFLTRYP